MLLRASWMASSQSESEAPSSSWAASSISSISTRRSPGPNGSCGSSAYDIPGVFPDGRSVERPPVSSLRDVGPRRGGLLDEVGRRQVDVHPPPPPADRDAVERDDRGVGDHRPPGG